MKPITILFSLTALVLVSSCKKNNTTPQVQKVPREIRYTLYTDKDFSTDDENILFTVFAKDANNNIIWDSLLAPMQVKDIPELANSIVVDKTVSADPNAVLKVGFLYTLENVGNSWYIDTMSAGSTFKAVNYNFQ